LTFVRALFDGTRGAYRYLGEFHLAARQEQL